MPHITPRDKNALFIRSQAITAIKFGINHFFVIGGDPISPEAESREVREIDVINFSSLTLFLFANPGKIFF